MVRAPVVLDRASRAAFRREALQMVESALGPDGTGSDRVVVDLENTVKVDSAGLGALIVIRERASELRRTVCLRGVSEELRFLLVLTQMSDRFEFEGPMT